MEGNQLNDVIPDEFKKKIMQSLILPNYQKNIEYMIHTRTCWSTTSTICLTASTLFIGISTLLSFASTNFPGAGFNFYAGTAGVLAIIVKEFASYANNQDHIKTVKTNDMLKNIGVKFEFEDTSDKDKRLIDKCVTFEMPQNEDEEEKKNDDNV
jgi:hypothetical protein